MRVEFSHDGRELLTCVDGTLRRHAIDGGGSVIVDGPAQLDARWQTDGTIIAVDTRSIVRRYGETTEQLAYPFGTLEHAVIAGERFLGIGPASVFVANFEGQWAWKLNADKHNLGATEERTSGALSNDGKLVAIGYETRSYAHASYGREGRGWLVIETVRDRVLDRSWAASSPGIVRREARPTGLAFDRNGRRLAFALPEPGQCIGAIRVGRDDRYGRAHLGGARAVAIDDRGLLAAYAYPKAITETTTGAMRRLRVDYLEPGAKGPAAITIVDTLWIDPDIDDIVGVAFDRASRRIACVDTNARVDVVPVP